MVLTHSERSPPVIATGMPVAFDPVAKTGKCLKSRGFTRLPGDVRRGAAGVRVQKMPRVRGRGIAELPIGEWAEASVTGAARIRTEW